MLFKLLSIILQKIIIWDEEIPNLYLVLKRKTISQLAQYYGQKMSNFQLKKM